MTICADEIYQGRRIKYYRKTINLCGHETLVINVRTADGKLEALRIRLDSEVDGNVLIAMKSGMLSYEFGSSTINKIMSQSEL